MNYIIKMMSGDVIFITTKEFKNLEGKTGLVFIPSQDRIINLNSVETITPIEIALEESKLAIKKVDSSDGSPLSYKNGEYFTLGGYCPMYALSIVEYKYKLVKDKLKELNADNKISLPTSGDT